MVLTQEHPVSKATLTTTVCRPHVWRGNIFVLISMTTRPCPSTRIPLESYCQGILPTEYCCWPCLCDSLSIVADHTFMTAWVLLLTRPLCEPEYCCWPGLCDRVLLLTRPLWQSSVTDQAFMTARVLLLTRPLWQSIVADQAFVTEDCCWPCLYDSLSIVTDHAFMITLC